MTRWQIDYTAKQARSAVDDLYKQCIEIEEAHTSIVGGQVMKLQKYPWVGNSVTYYSSPDLAIAAYDKEFEACKKVHEENLKAIANNTNIKSALIIQITLRALLMFSSFTIKVAAIICVY